MNFLDFVSYFVMWNVPCDDLPESTRTIGPSELNDSSQYCDGRVLSESVQAELQVRTSTRPDFLPFALRTKLAMNCPT